MFTLPSQLSTCNVSYTCQAVELSAKMANLRQKNIRNRQKKKSSAKKKIWYDRRAELVPFTRVNSLMNRRE